MENLALTYDDLCDEIDYAVSNELDICVIVNGDLASEIVNYLDKEHGMKSIGKTYEFCDEIVYSVNIKTDNDLSYFVQEAYYKGELLEDDKSVDITYIDIQTELTLLDMKNIHSKQVITFELEEECDCCDCENCQSQEEYDALAILLDRIETLEDKVEELASYHNNEHYMINDIEVSKEIYDGFYEQIKEIQKQMIRSRARLF